MSYERFYQALLEELIACRFDARAEISHVDLAKKVGVSPTTLSGKLNGSRDASFSLEQLFNFCEATLFDIDDVVGLAYQAAKGDRK